LRLCCVCSNASGCLRLWSIASEECLPQPAPKTRGQSLFKASQPSRYSLVLWQTWAQHVYITAMCSVAQQSLQSTSVCTWYVGFEVKDYSLHQINTYIFLSGRKSKFCVSHTLISCNSVSFLPTWIPHLSSTWLTRCQVYILYNDNITLKEIVQL